MTIAHTERHIGKTKLRLTQRGKIVVALTAIVSILTLLALYNVNIATPEECRDGLLNIKQTPQCEKFMIRG